MAKFLFTMLVVNDPGLPTRLVPVAQVLADRGHVVALFNPAPAPEKVIADAGLVNLPMPSRPMPAIARRHGWSERRLGCRGDVWSFVFR
jgi:hypothetical protein